MLLVEQTLLVQPPQWAVSVSVWISQPLLPLLPSQSEKPRAHVPPHTPPEQERVMFDCEQTVPQPPQLSGSLLVLPLTSVHVPSCPLMSHEKQFPEHEDVPQHTVLTQKPLAQSLPEVHFSPIDFGQSGSVGLVQPLGQSPSWSPHATHLETLLTTAHATGHSV